MNAKAENNCSDCSAEIERLQKAARKAKTPKERKAIFSKLEELTGGSRETNVLEGYTRWIRTRVDYDTN